MLKTTRRAGLVAVAVVMSLSAVSASADTDAGTRLSVSGVDIVGFPYVDLILSGVPGLGAGNPPPITVTQSGQRLPATFSWALSPGQPLAVIMDAPAADRAPVQGIVAELVQELPPDLPLTLVSTFSGRAVDVGTNRDAFMTRLGQQRTRTVLPISVGVKAVAAAGIQHVFVVTTCESPAPAASPVGVMVDVLAVGPSCTNSWKAALTSGAGGYTTAGDLTSGLAALDAMVAQWQSSVVVVAQAFSREPIVLGTGGDRVTAPLDAALAASPASAGPSAAASAQPSKAEASTGESRSAGLVLILGVLLLLLAVMLAIVWAWRRRHTPRQAASVAPAPPQVAAPARGANPVEAVVAEEVEAAAPLEAEPIQRVELVVQRGSGQLGSPRRSGQPVRSGPATVNAKVANGPNGKGGQRGQRGQNGRNGETARPAQNGDGETARPPDVVIDLREQPSVVADAGLVPDEASDMPLMAVATPEAVREAEPSQPAAVAERDDFEEPVAMAEEQSADEVQTEEVAVDEAQPEQPAAEAPVDEAPADEASADEAVVDQAVADEVHQEAVQDEAQDEVQNEDKDEAEEDRPPAMPAMSEFNWTPMTFTPLVWRYDAEPEPASTIDLRESADVDLREKSERKAPRRRKARR
ncbi:MAG: hypothetical protein M3P23_10090 [Actinomycetota bacterium]|nr:hypothetical protein [Actinomycetota bacterium]